MMTVKCKVRVWSCDMSGDIIIPLEYETHNMSPIDTFDIEGDIRKDLRNVFSITNDYDLFVDIEGKENEYGL